MLLKIKDHRKFSWGYPRILFKTKCLAVLTHYLTENKWLGNTRLEIAPEGSCVGFLQTKPECVRKQRGSENVISR